MKLINLNFDSKSPFLPEIKIPFFLTNFPKENLRLMYRAILDKEKWIIENTKPYPPEDDPKWITNRLYEYNLFQFSEEYPVLNDYKKFISESYKQYCSSLNTPASKVYITCWANILRNDGRNITPHNHSDGHADCPEEYAYISGTMCLNDLGTHTSFKSPFSNNMYNDIKNIPGENILFPSWVFHKTDVNTAPIPRVSIAYDIITQEQYDLAQVQERKSNFILLE
jgi:hypothetical protein